MNREQMRVKVVEVSERIYQTCHRHKHEVAVKRIQRAILDLFEKEVGDG